MTWRQLSVIFISDFTNNFIGNNNRPKFLLIHRESRNLCSKTTSKRLIMAYSGLLKCAIHCCRQEQEQSAGLNSSTAETFGGIPLRNIPWQLNTVHFSNRMRWRISVLRWTWMSTTLQAWTDCWVMDALGRVQKSMILFAAHNKPFPRAGKVFGRESHGIGGLRDYKQELDNWFDAAEGHASRDWFECLSL